MPRTEIFIHGEDVSVVTTATDERDFVETFSRSLTFLAAKMGKIPNTEEEKKADPRPWERVQREHDKAVAAGFELLAKIRGYKAPSVQERRMLAAGRWPHPADEPVAYGGEHENGQE